MKLVNPLKDFAAELNSVQSPSRYTGGEYGSIIKPHTAEHDYFNYVVAFPDIYEIGMSNLAIKIIYNGLNAREGIRCERVFAPESDFEKLLKDKDIPLYSLETGMPLNETDMVSFSIGYELGITEVLAMLEDGKIPLTNEERSEEDPIVIAGGCGVTNPAPFGDFFDAIMIGEAENKLFDMVQHVAEMTKAGASRKEKLEYIKSMPFMWSNGCKKARRAVQSDFGLVPSVPDWFPLPVIKPVQDHGVIEIMRGCPNGCRFCHAGIYYRPTRVKSFKLIVDEIDHLVFDAGYREVSLNSLSSADFPDVEGLLDFLNERYKGYNVSFQLPSLKVNSMSLGVLEKLNQVRKSGLTFAVETPEEMWQLSLNKEVYAQHLEEIIRTAKEKGWSSAKFYFMIGLPVGDYFGRENNPSGKTEEQAIVDFLLELQARTRIQCNVNVGVYIPKPHTPYQWVKQLTVEQAKEKMDYIYKNLPRGKFKLGRHNYDMTILEGLFSRGDERAGKVILNAFKKGARLDAWDEHLTENMKFWNEAFAEADWNVMDYIYKDWSLEEELPWDSVSLGPSKGWYKKEWQSSIDHVLTKRCMADCDHPCGICNTKEQTKVFKKEELESVSACIQNKTVVTPEYHPESNIPVLYRVVFSFTRKDGAEYTAYLSQVETFHKAILRSGLPFVFTSGFNPLPRLEFATAMSLGIPSDDEIASCVLYDPMDESKFIEVMNSKLPENLHITKAMIFPVSNLRKRESLTNNLWGGNYKITFKEGFSAADFFNSEKGRELLGDTENYKFNFADESYSQSFEAKFFNSDKKFRTAVEECFNEKWYNILVSEKTETLATTVITGWTADNEMQWRHDNKNFVRQEAGGSKDETVTYFELYRRIAKINADLINAREVLTQERESFYKKHPDVKQQHIENKKTAEASEKTPEDGKQ